MRRFLQSLNHGDVAALVAEQDDQFGLLRQIEALPDDGAAKT